MDRALLLLMALVVCLQANAGTLVLTSSGGKRFASSSGSSLPVGTAVRLGTFNLPDATRDQTLRGTKDYAQLKALFKPLAEGVIGAGSTAQSAGNGTVLRSNDYPAAGEIFGIISDISASYLPAGTRLYVWVFDSANPDNCSQWGIYTSADWVAPQAFGTQTLSTAASVDVIYGSSTAGQLQLAKPASTYGNWSWKNFTLAAPASMTAQTADPDNDGIANLAEYAWKLNPAAQDKPRTTLTAGVTTGATFSFQAPRNLPDVSVSAEWSTDLVHWSPAPASLTSSDSEFDTYTSSAGAGDRCFWRVRFTPASTP